MDKKKMLMVDDFFTLFFTLIILDYNQIAIKNNISSCFFPFYNVPYYKEILGNINYRRYNGMLTSPEVELTLFNFEKSNKISIGEGGIIIFKNVLDLNYEKHYDAIYIEKSRKLINAIINNLKL